MCLGNSDDLALRNAIADLETRFQRCDGAIWWRTPDPLAAQARSDWAANDIHLLTFDEDNNVGLLPQSGSGVVAITPLEFYTTGRILDADVIFNGKDFRFTTEGTPGRFDIQDVAAHELGHLLGLDHSGVAGATMYPYVDPSLVLHRSLAMDDIAGLRDIYPSVNFGVITGTLKRSLDQSVVAGGYVVATDASGRTVGSALADANGVYRLEGLTGGVYSVWADPLDQPVSAANLTTGHTVHTDFESKYLGQVTLALGATESMGDQSLDGDVSISLGMVADDYPLRVISGRTVARTVRGSGLVAGSSLTTMDPSVTIDGAVFSGTSISFNVTIPAGSAAGHLDLLVTNPLGEKDLLPGALEVTPSSPDVDFVVPNSGPGAGGYTLELTGENFRPVRGW